MVNVNTSPADTLVVDDDDDESLTRTLITTALSRNGIAVDSASTVEEAIAMIKQNGYRVVLTDLYFPEARGPEVVQEARRANPDSYVVLMSDGGDISIAVKCKKLGAADFLQKPFEMQDLIKVVARGLERTSGVKTARAEHEDGTASFVVASPQMQEVLRLINHAAPTSSTILIRGESGTGKEVVARAIHQRSQRKSRPFVALNCAAVPDHLLEDELFGHVRGAFTGADKIRMGRFELAHQGTLFLDEIGSMSLHLQAKLLRVLQEREFERVGSAVTIQCDVRIIAATNADLESLVRRGEFREDLYYRLNVIPVTLPPLRDRLHDVAPLVEHFLAKLCAQSHFGTKRVTEEAMERLTEHRWPGNVRELQNAIERAVVLTGAREWMYPEDFSGILGSVARPAIPISIPQPQAGSEGEGIDFENVVSEFERRLILQILQKTGGNKRKAADLLQLKRTTLGAKIRRLRLERFAQSA